MGPHHTEKWPYLRPRGLGGLIKTGSEKLSIYLLLSDINCLNMVCCQPSTRGCWCTPRWGPRADSVVGCGLVQGRHDGRKRCGQTGGSARSPPSYTHDEDVASIEKDGEIL